MATIASLHPNHMPEKEPSVTDLNYYAKPENYTGSDFRAMQKIIFVQSKQNLGNNNYTNEDVGPMNRIYERYKDIGKTKSELLADKAAAEEDERKKSNEIGHFENDEIAERKISNGSSRTFSRPETPMEYYQMHHPSRKVSGYSSGPYRYSRIYSKGLPQKELRKQMARARFQHAIKIVLILQKWINSLTEKEEDEGKAGKAPAAKTFTDIASEAFQSDQFREAGLSFDLSYFKAKKEGNQDVNISNEVKHVLSIPSVARTPDQLQTALYGLQHLKSFAEYPLHMQEKLCKVAWFQQVPPKRVIIRQGHFAENFYFILSGQAVVRILEKNPQSGETQLRTATIMRKGTSFGELALLHHSLRTATVVSQDSVQLLTIGRDDFFDIFMSGSGPGQIPEHIQFVAGLDFMGNFPIDKLLENPEYCLFHFFKRGVVIVKDSNVSDWIYIVKSGSCQVMKELKGVTPRVGRCKSATPREEPGPKLPRLGVGDTYTKVNTGLRKPKIHSLSAPHPLRREQTFNGEDLTKSHFDSSENDPVDQVHNENAQHTSRSQPEIYDDSNKGREINPVMLTTLNHNGEAKPGFSKSRYRHMSLTTKKAHFLNEEDIKNDINKKQTKPGSAKSSSTRSAPTSARRRVRTPVKKEETDDYYDEEEFSLKGPVFVKVELLKPKDVFGLNTVDFDYEPTSNSTSVSLVSNGAECIMLSKKFFTENANELVKCNVRYLVRSYPPEEALQDNLQNKVDWNVYKKRLIRQTIHNMHKVSVR